MKHILNNLSEEEKNAIREQHTGGMKVMTENFSKLLNSKLGDSKPLVNEQDDVVQPTSPSRTIDLKKIKEIFLSKGFKNTPYQGYSFHMDRPNNGPVKDKKGNYVVSYETYIPLKQPSLGFGITDGNTKQLWVDKRGGLKPGTDEPNTYNLIFDLNPNKLIMQSVKNGKVISKKTITLDDFYKELQEYN
jgi:hypothetical protein